jgi:hypothetical protein
VSSPSPARGSSYMGLFFSSSVFASLASHGPSRNVTQMTQMTQMTHLPYIRAERAAWPEWWRAA